MKQLLIFVVLAFSFISISHAQPQTFSSGDKQVNVIELYTSEGCSSCPPADKWLTGFKDDSRLWNEIIPLAFHVDYWDYIGWKDRFAEAQFGDRQRYYAFSDQLSGVYTPGVMLNGREWRGWYRNMPIQKTADRAGELSIKLNGDQLDVSFDSTDTKALFNVNIAVLGFDLKSEINRGENRGRELTHDFVVLGHKQVRLQREDGQFKVSTVLPELKLRADKLAIAVWVNQSKDLTPLQATGGWLNN